MRQERRESSMKACKKARDLESEGSNGGEQGHKGGNRESTSKRKIHSQAELDETTDGYTIV